MIKTILTFIAIYAFFHLGIHTVKTLTDGERWSLTKTVIYSIICSVLTLATLTTIVILF